MSPDSTANSLWADSQDGQEKGLLKIHESQVLGHVVQGQTLTSTWSPACTQELTGLWLKGEQAKHILSLTVGPTLQVLRNES